MGSSESKIDTVIDSNLLQTGDILLFTGTSWLDKAIQYFGKSPYCHVAMVLKDPTFIKPDLIGTYILESGFEQFQDAEDNKIKLGVQINRLDKVMTGYMFDKVFVRRLTCSRDDNFYNTLIQIHKEVHNKPYDLMFTDWLEAKALVNINDIEFVQNMFRTNDTHKTQTFWCSALIAYVFHRLGFIKDGKIPWSIIAPREFSTEGQNLEFVHCKLGNEIPVVNTMV